MRAVLPQQLHVWFRPGLSRGNFSGTRIILPANQGVAANRACIFTSNTEISCRVRVKRRQTD